MRYIVLMAIMAVTLLVVAACGGESTRTPTATQESSGLGNQTRQPAVEAEAPIAQPASQERRIVPEQLPIPPTLLGETRASLPRESLPELLLFAPHAFYDTLGSPRQALAPRPVDPTTLADLRGYTPLDLGNHQTHVLSHDGRTLAVLAWHDAPYLRENCAGEGDRRECKSYRPGEQRLHLVDVSSWTQQVTTMGADEGFSIPTFSADNKSLYWFTSRSELSRYDLATHTSTAVAKLPEGFTPRAARILKRGNRLAVYSVQDRQGEADGAPSVAILDLETGSTVADIRLDGLVDGLVGAIEVGLPPKLYRAGLAWDLEHDRLYVVHADSEEVSVVDLALGKLLRQDEVWRKQSLLERALGWLIRPAYAKELPGVERRVALSKDGAWLYVTGVRTDWDATGRVTRAPLGLRVFATGTLQEIRWLDLPVSDVALSPDGTRLLLGSATTLALTPSQLYVLDSTTLAELAHVEQEALVRLHGFSEDGGYAYISTRRSQPTWEYVVKVLDLSTLAVVGERSLLLSYPQPLLRLRR